MTGPDDVVTARDALATAMSVLQTSHPDDTGAISTGHVDLDELLGGGFWPGHLHVVAGSPAVGKSMHLLNLARAASMRDGSALYTSPQHDQHEVALRLMATECKVPLNHLRAGLLASDDWAKIDRHRDRLGNSRCTSILRQCGGWTPCSPLSRGSNRNRVFWLSTASPTTSSQREFAR